MYGDIWFESKFRPEDASKLKSGKKSACTIGNMWLLSVCICSFMFGNEREREREREREYHCLSAGR